MASLRDRADESYRDWRVTSGHYLVGGCQAFVDGFLRGYDAANNSPKVVESTIPNKGGQDCANSLPLATEEVGPGDVE